MAAAKPPEPSGKRRAANDQRQAMELTQMLHRAARLEPGATAVVDGSLRWRYADLLDEVARRAGQLSSVGIGHGDRVALLATNSAPAIGLMFACWWVGAVFCPLNTRWADAELAHALTDCEPVAVFADAAHRQRVEALLPLQGLHGADTGKPRCLRIDEPPPAAALLRDARAGGADLAALIYTGGTTGRAKGVMLSHGNLLASAVCRLADNDSLRGSVGLVSTPVFHIASITRVLPHLLAGGCLVMFPAFEAGAALDLIEQESVTDAPLVPTMLQMLLEHPSFRPQRLRSVRRLSYGAAPAAGALLLRAMALLPWVALHQYYGMTESSAVATMSAASDHDEAGWRDGRAASAGRACALVEIRVVDAQGHERPAGAIGEILVRGPVVSPGYWRRPEESAATFRDGWLHTGDAGRLDGGGYLTVVDRVKDMIVSGGENVYSAEVENALAAHPDVAAAAVIGIPNERWGEAVHALVVRRADAEGLDQAALQDHCRRLIAGYKVPKRIEFIERLPLTPAGKVNKALLREPYWSHLGRGVN